MTASIPSTVTLAARWQQYTALTKPRVVQLIVFCAVIGMLLAAAVGTGFGPALHRKIFPRRTRRHPRHHISRHSSK